MELTGTTHRRFATTLNSPAAPVTVVLLLLLLLPLPDQRPASLRLHLRRPTRPRLTMKRSTRPGNHPRTTEATTTSHGLRPQPLGALTGPLFQRFLHSPGISRLCATSPTGHGTGQASESTGQRTLTQRFAPTSSMALLSLIQTNSL